MGTIFDKCGDEHNGVAVMGYGALLKLYRNAMNGVRVISDGFTDKFKVKHPCDEGMDDSVTLNVTVVYPKHFCDPEAGHKYGEVGFYITADTPDENHIFLYRGHDVDVSRDAVGWANWEKWLPEIYNREVIDTGFPHTGISLKSIHRFAESVFSFSGEQTFSIELPGRKVYTVQNISNCDSSKTILMAFVEEKTGLLIGIMEADLFGNGNISICLRDITLDNSIIAITRPDDSRKRDVYGELATVLDSLLESLGLTSE